MRSVEAARSIVLPKATDRRQFGASKVKARGARDRLTILFPSSIPAISPITAVQQSTIWLT
jgi:hypothetical protein